MLLELKNIGKVFVNGQTQNSVLDGVDLELNAGDYVAITGPSGAGKSTLLNIIAGLESADTGELFFEGKNQKSFNDNELNSYRQKDIGIVFQQHFLLEQCTVLENVLLPTLPLKNVDRVELIERANYLLNRANIYQCRDQFAGELSGGESQRVAVCRALINQPKLLLADEPTGSLDHHNAVELLELLVSMVEENMSLLMVTHWSEAADAMSRKLVLKDAKLQEDNR